MSGPARPLSSAVTGRARVRPSSDFYPSRPGAVRALLQVERFAGPVWEPACGDGAISEVFERAGHRVVSTDLNPHGYGCAGVDFFKMRRLAAPDIVTNPPFHCDSDFVRHALRLRARKVAMFLRLAFLEAGERSDILEREMGGLRLARVWVFRNRITMFPKGVADGRVDGGAMAFAWFVWEQGHRGPWCGGRLTADDREDRRAS